MAAGGELIIDDKLVRAIHDMEKALQGVTKEADATQRKTMAWLSSLSSGNIDAFTNKIKQLESNYMNLANALSNSKGFENLSEKALNTAGAITQLITVMGQNTPKKTDGFDSIRQTLDSLLAQLAKARQDIDLYYQAIGTGKKEYIEFGQTGLKEAEARAESLMRKIEALNTTYQQLKQSSFNITDLTKGTMDDERSRIELSDIKMRLQEEERVHRAVMEHNLEELKAINDKIEAGIQGEKALAKAEEERHRKRQEYYNNVGKQWDIDDKAIRDANMTELKAISDKVENAKRAEKEAVESAKREHDAKQKYYEDFGKIIEEEEKRKKQANTDYYNWEMEQLAKEVKAAQDAANKKLQAEQEYAAKRKELQAMYTSLWDRNEADMMSARVAQRTNGQTWNVDANEVIRRTQEELAQRRQYIAERTAMYERMFEEIERKEKKVQDDIRNYEQQKQNESLAKYKQQKEEQARVDKHYHDKRQREYDEMFKAIERNEKRQRAINAKYGDSSKGAFNYSNRLYSAQGVRSIQNMETALNKLRDAQRRLNVGTEEGRKRFAELGAQIKKIEGDLNRVTDAGERMKKSHSGLINTGQQLARQLALVFSVSQIQGYMGKIVQVRKEFERQQRSLQILVQNQNEANKLWNQTVQLAVKSPFRVKELVTYTKQLAAYRIETEKLHDTTKMLADVSAGLGVDMNRLILAYGQVRAAEFLRGTELRQFTEAYIPMLEELSKHFSELEGRAVSTADVFERISKRMVVFEDVDAVFKKITSEGGIFYKMQEKQSETLYGMIANLHDSLDLMMNDIGKSNEWVLKGAVSLTKTLVEQWRVLADVIAAVGIGVMYKQLNLVVRGFQAAAVHSTLATKSLSGMALMGAKANVAFKTLSKTLTKMVVAHPWIAIGVAIAAAARAVWQYSDAIDRANKKYDDMSRSDIERINKLQKINAQIKENNSLIKDSTKSQQIHNEAQENNNRLLEELKALYPDVYREIKMQSNGILEVSNEIDRQNRLLRLNISLQQQAKGGAFFDDLSTNYNELVTQMTIVESKIQGLQNKAVDAQVKLLNDLNKGAVSQPIYDKFNAYLQQLVDVKDLKEVGKILEDIHKFSRSEFRLSGFSAQKYLGEINTLTMELAKSNWWQKIWPEENFLSSLDRMMSSFSVGLQDIYNTDGNDAAVKWLDEQLDLLNILDKKIRDIAKRHIVQEVGVNLEFKSGNKTYTEDDLKHEWQKVIWGYIKEIQATDPKIAFGITIEALVTKDKNKIVQQLQEQVKPLKDEIDKNLNAVQNLPEQVAYSDEQVNKMQKTLPLLEGFAKALALWESPKSGGTGKDWFAEMGKAIRDTHKDFLTLHKDLDETRALELAMEKHSDVFAEAAKGAKMVGLSLRDFSSLLVEDNAISALEDLLGRIPESAAKSRLAIEKMIGELRGGEEVRKAQEDYEKLNNQIEQLFGTYELSLELKDMNIPTDIAEKLFGFETLDLKGLKEKLKELEPQFIGTDQEKKYRDYLQKVEEMEAKALKDRIKKFYKFLQDTTDAIQVAQQEGALDIQFATELFNSGKLTVEQYNQAVRKIIADTNKEISKLNLDKFKDSPEYIAAMGDMAGYTAMELTKLQNAIKNLIAKSSSTMQPEEIKAYNDALDKINDQLDRLKSPFSKTAISEIKEINRLNKELDAEKAKQLELEKRRRELETQESELTTQLSQQKYHGAPQEEIDETISKIQETQEGIAKINGDLNTTAGNIANIGNKLQKLYGGSSKGWAKANKALTETFMAIDGAVQIFNEVKDLAASFGADVDTGAWSDLSIIFSGIGEMSQKFQSGWQSFLSGDIVGGVAGFLGGVFSVIKLFNQLHDNKLEKQIKQQEHQVKLMGKAYEKLEMQMEGAYSTDSIKQNTDEMLKNLEEQAAANEKMAELEQAKKDTDKEKVEQYLEERDKALEEREKLLIEREKAFGGFGGQEDYKSASEEFVDAWLSAFKETGSGLKGLQEKFDEFFIDMIKKQLLNNVMEKSMTAFYDAWDTALADGRMDAQEAESLKQAWKTLQGELDSKLQAMTEVIGVADDIRGTAELGTLQKGIQGVTEDTAEIIASYLNAMRFMLGEQSSNIKSITDNYGNIEAPNTMLGQLKMIADNTRAINDLLGSVTKAGHREGGYGIKVFTD